MAEPIIIFQMQRMGDIILTFPLLTWLRALFTDHPLYVAAEANFFKELLPLSPPVTYVPWKTAEKLVGGSYRLVVNLSLRPEAAALAGRLKAAQTLGPVRDEKSITYMHGDWQLYRAGLTNNNRHNAFHWADMNALDIIPTAMIKGTVWPKKQNPSPGAEGLPRIGLFLGASEESKRPAPEFWAALAQELLRIGCRPLLLGGKAEQDLGRQTASLMKHPAPNFCGRFTLPEFAAFSSTLDLLITPDTGPMHFAAWLGLKVLNLSMGPVNPWETGPYQPGHIVLQARDSCVGCWQCRRQEIYCRQAFPARSVAALALNLISEEGRNKTPVPPGSLSIRRSGRDRHGLYHLERLSGEKPIAREALTELWREYFGALFGLWETRRVRESREKLAALNPALSGRLDAQLGQLALKLVQAFKKGAFPLGEGFWSDKAPLLRPLAGYMQMLLQNADYSQTALTRALTMIERLKDC